MCWCSTETTAFAPSSAACSIYAAYAIVIGELRLLLELGVAPCHFSAHRREEVAQRLHALDRAESFPCRHVVAHLQVDIHQGDVAQLLDGEARDSHVHSAAI